LWHPAPARAQVFCFQAGCCPVDVKSWRNGDAGLKMAEARTGNTKPLQAGGALMLGGEQVP